MQFSTSLIAFVALYLNTVQGHMVMKSPVPYGKSTLNNSPLVADGSDFPCKQRAGVYELEGASNILEIGASNTLSFTGGATHNGGSCQVSLTTDLEPTKNSKWMVIKSIEGGCPVAAGTGNLSDDPNGSGAATFQYTVPDGIAPGKYTIAWTWINHTGNREFYMNCGPADVVGAKKKRYNPNPIVRRQSNFPDLAVINLSGVNSCRNTEGNDFVYQDGGADVEKNGAGPFETLTCGQSAGGAAQAPAATGAATGAASVASSVATSAPAAGTGDAGTAPSASAGVFATVSVATVQVGEPTPISAVAAPAAPASTGSTGSTGSSSNSSSGSSTGATGSCTAGDWNCLDGVSFQRCVAGGTWSATMPISAGMKCTVGTSSTLNWAPGKVKRVVRTNTGLFDGYQS